MNMTSRIEVLAFNTLDNVLIGKNPRNGHFMFPGGKIDLGETPLESAKREIEEESGYRARNLKMVGTAPSIFVTSDLVETTLFFSADVMKKGPSEAHTDDRMEELDFYTQDEAIELLGLTNPNREYDQVVKDRIKALNQAYKDRYANMEKTADVEQIFSDEEYIDPTDELIRYHMLNTHEDPDTTSIVLMEEPSRYFDSSDIDEPNLKDYMMYQTSVALQEKKSSTVRTELFTKSASLVATAGQHMINSMLPTDMRDYDRVLDSSNIKKMYQKLAEKYPEQFKEAGDKIRMIGDRESVFSVEHIKHSDLRSPIDIKPYLESAKKEYDKAENKEYALIDVYAKTKEQLVKDTQTAGTKAHNNFTFMATSGAKGSPVQITDMITTPLLVSDYKNRPIPVIINKSYSQGLSPAQYFASSYGTRRGMISTKLAVPLSGYLSKMLSWSMAPVVVTEDDCKTVNGVSYTIDDVYNIGRYAVIDGKSVYLDEKVISNLKNKGISKLVIRSPISCAAKQGICKICLGKTELGTLAPMGYNAGINSAAAMSEPLSQGMLSEKHTGGAVKKRVGGFPLIERLVKIPDKFPEKSILSELRGEVKSIEPASWGGWMVRVNDKNHYTPQTNKPSVKVGDMMEKGDPLSEGIVNAAEVTSLKGIGDGRVSLASSLRNAFEEMGTKLDRIHYEIAGKSFVNFGRVDGDKNIGNLLPGEIGRLDQTGTDIEYPDAKEEDINTLVPYNIYLAKAVLHYQPGTEITLQMVNNLRGNNISKIWTTKTKLPLTPLMIRVQDTALYDKDWITRLSSQGLKRSILEGVWKGHKSPMKGLSPTHPFVYGTEFGKGKLY